MRDFRQAAPSPGGSRQAAQAPAEIVVIDDDAAVLEMSLLLLRESGFDARGFVDPLDALMWISDAEPTCILADLKLPGVEGLDLVAAFCALGRHAVIIVSSYADVAITVDAMRLGVDNVLTKPASHDDMIAAVRRAVDILATTPAQDALTFTRRERQVAEHIMAGRTTKQIAIALSLSPRTVEFFRTSLLRKTHSPNSMALAAALARSGFGAAVIEGLGRIRI